MNTKTEDILRKHCHIYYGAITGEEIVDSTISAVCIAMEEYASEQCQKRDELDEIKDELIEWLDQECPSVVPPLEPYTNYDLTHDFCDGLRIRLDKIKQLKKEIL